MTVSTDPTRNGIPTNVGTITNDNAAAGNIGEHIIAAVPSTAGVTLTTDVGIDLLSVQLTAGDWELYWRVNYYGFGANITRFLAGPSVTAGVFPIRNQTGPVSPEAFTVSNIPITSLSGVHPMMSIPIRVSLAATTTIYLVVNASFTIAGVEAYGTMRARRVR